MLEKLGSPETRNRIAEQRQPPSLICMMLPHGISGRLGLGVTPLESYQDGAAAAPKEVGTQAGGQL